MREKKFTAIVILLVLILVFLIGIGVYIHHLEKARPKIALGSSYIEFVDDASEEGNPEYTLVTDEAKEFNFTRFNALYQEADHGSFTHDPAKEEYLLTDESHNRFGTITPIDSEHVGLSLDDGTYILFRLLSK